MGWLAAAPNAVQEAYDALDDQTKRAAYDCQIGSDLEPFASGRNEHCDFEIFRFGLHPKWTSLHKRVIRGRNGVLKYATATAPGANERHSERAFESLRSF